jgi:phage N-6-adenine-methyltransferase
MSLVGYRASNHPQQVGKRGPRPEIDDRATTPEMFGPLNDRFHFTIDVAASPANAKCERFYTTADNGLAQSWAGERVWCNPPYSNIVPWVAKASWDMDSPCTAADLIVMLLPANRTEQKWWQEYVEPYRDQGCGLRVEFMPGRPRFIRASSADVGPNERPPFGCCLLIWGAS